MRELPDFPLHSALTELDPLSTPFEEREAVDVLLDDLAIQPAQQRGGGRAVLVVDASPIARKFLVRRLQLLGYDAQGADDGEAALALLAKQAFAIVFLELRLGGDEAIDGLNLCQAIKQTLVHPGGVAPAVVVTTGQSGSSSRVHGSLAGCDAYLTKPLIEAKFIAALRDVDPQFA